VSLMVTVRLGSLPPQKVEVNLLCMCKIEGRQGGNRYVPPRPTSLTLLTSLTSLTSLTLLTLLAFEQLHYPLPHHPAAVVGIPVGPLDNLHIGADFEPVKHDL
jgi:hypothetical protein